MSSLPLPPPPLPFTDAAAITDWVQFKNGTSNGPCYADEFVIEAATLKELLQLKPIHDLYSTDIIFKHSLLTIVSRIDTTKPFEYRKSMTLKNVLFLFRLRRVNYDYTPFMSLFFSDYSKLYFSYSITEFGDEDEGEFVMQCTSASHYPKMDKEEEKLIGHLD